MSAGATKDRAEPFFQRGEDGARAVFEAMDGVAGLLTGIEHGAALELRADAEALLRRLRQLRVFRDRP